MEIRAIIVDDEEDGRIVLKHHLTKNCKNINLIESFSNVDDTISFLKSNTIDLIFLDINMPEKNGFALLEELGKYDFNVIFVTAYNEFAIKAFKYSAFDYLLKPIDPEELLRSITRLEHSEFMPQKTKTLLDNLKENTPTQIALPTRDGYSFINTTKIIRCEGDSNYCRIYTQEGTEHMATKTLKNMQEILPTDAFFRIHKSHIINVNYVQSYSSSNGNVVILKNGNAVEVSRRNKEAFLTKMRSL